MIDAGSSASRLYLYKFVDDGRAIEDVLELGSPAAALSAYAGDAGAGDKAIAPLLAALDQALAQRGIGKSRRRQTVHEETRLVWFLRFQRLAVGPDK